jgi:Asp-tRNA(Asn)/Glu-tRNA(Gln) amidotransferase A subunit family amidase
MLDGVATAGLIRERELSPVEAVDEALARAEAIQPALNPYTVVLADEARAAARDAERALASGAETGPLHGVPVSVKDVIWMRGVRATNGSRAYRDFVPPEDAVAVERLRAAGAIVVGKTNNPELCLSGYTDNEVFGLTRNPWDPGRTPGGSSGGCGTAVACAAPGLGLGSDGGGSIRIPAAFCGVAGHKPTYGLVPLGPGFGGWRSLSVVGPLARTTRDLALCLDVIAGADRRDETTLAWPRESYLAGLAEPLPPLRVAFSADLGTVPLEPGVRAAFEAAVERLGAAGWHLEEAHPRTPHPIGLWGRIALCEGFHALLAEHREELEPRTVAILEASARCTLDDYLQAVEERAAYTRAWLAFFERYDLLLTPSVELAAFPVGLEMPETIGDVPVDPEVEDWANFCVAVNLTGQPAASVPCGFDERSLPVGLQIVGRRFEDGLVLRAAAAWEEIAPWADRLPPAGRGRTD